jgi:hypothetical protein
VSKFDTASKRFLAYGKVRKMREVAEYVREYSAYGDVDGVLSVDLEAFANVIQSYAELEEPVR